MAVRHGKAGQYGKNQAARHFSRYFLLLLTFAAIAFTTLGFATGYAWKLYGAVAAFVAAVPVLFIVLYATRWIDPHLEKIAKERIYHLKGAQLEAVVAWVLEDLDDHWHIFNGIKLERESDIDHVLVGPAGVYCISTKANRGHFVGTADGLLHNGNPCDFATKALWMAMDVRKRLEAILGNDVPFVQPVLAVPIGFTDGDACDGKVWLVHQWDIIERLAPDPLRRKPLPADQINRTVRALELIQNGAAEIFQRPNRSATSPS